MRAPAALAALATLALAAALPAQKQGFEGTPIEEDGRISLSVKVAHPVARVYRHALDAMVEAGHPPSILLLNEWLVTQPSFATPGKPDATVVVHFTAAGDSTAVEVEGQPFWPDPDRPCRDDVCAMVSMKATLEVIDAITTALDSARPEPSSAADSLAAARAYGYAPENPVRVGGGRESGAQLEREYLASLRGPGGEPVSFFRLGSCCEFVPPGETEPTARIDAYEVTYAGLPKPVLLYFDIYRGTDAGAAPPGFTRAPAAPPPST